MLVGPSLMVNFRVLGVAPRLPIAPLERFFPVMWAGFWINVASGTLLFAQDATAAVTNVLFGLKMMLIALAVLDTVLMRRVVFRRALADGPISPLGKCLAAASIILWLGATTAGRLMVYVGQGAGAPVFDRQVGG